MHLLSRGRYLTRWNSISMLIAFYTVPRTNLTLTKQFSTCSCTERNKRHLGDLIVRRKKIFDSWHGDPYFALPWYIVSFDAAVLVVWLTLFSWVFHRSNVVVDSAANFDQSNWDVYFTLFGVKQFNSNIGPSMLPCLVWKIMLCVLPELFLIICRSHGVPV